MKFSMFVLVFSLCSGLTVSFSIEIEDEIGIQIWQTYEKEKIEKIPFYGLFNFNASETYIVLEITRKRNTYHYSLYYWVGSQSSQKQRQYLAETVALLYYHLKQKNVQSLFFSREVEGYESEYFSYLFGLGTRLKILKLYRIQEFGEDATISMFPVPCDCLFSSDVYVLDKGNAVSIWLGNLQQEESWIANLLAQRIVKVDLRKKDARPENYISVIDELLNKESYYTKLDIFLQEISDPKKYCRIQEENICIVKNNRKQIELLRYHIDGESVIKEKILERQLILSKLQSDEAYVLKNYVSRHTFVYLGKRADGLLIQRALAYAEVAFTGMRRLSAWKKITVIREGEVAPTHFVIHFEDEIKNLLAVPNESQLSRKWFRNTQQ